MTRNIEDINRLTTSIYSAPLDQSQWYGVMTQMTKIFDGTAAILAAALVDRPLDCRLCRGGRYHRKHCALDARTSLGKDRLSATSGSRPSSRDNRQGVIMNLCHGFI